MKDKFQSPPEEIYILSIPRQKEKIHIKKKNNNVFVDLNRITHIQYIKQISVVYTISGNKHCSSKTLKSFEILLFAYGFIRINRNTIVNCSYIDYCEFNAAPYLKLINSYRFSVAKNRIKAINKFFRSYIND